MRLIHKIGLLGSTTIAAAIITGCGGGNGGGVTNPTATPVGTTTPTSTPNPNATSTATPIVTATAVSTPTPSANATATPRPNPLQFSLPLTNVSADYNGATRSIALPFEGASLSQSGTPRSLNIEFANANASLLFSLRKQGTFAAGDVFQFSGAASQGAISSYYEVARPGFRLSRVGLAAPLEGTATIKSISPTGVYIIDLDSVTYRPATDTPNNLARGSFTLDGEFSFILRSTPTR